MSEEKGSTVEMDSKSNNCRMYEQKFPEQDELVLVTVRSVAELGA
jgi:hypothetical protein